MAETWLPQEPPPPAPVKSKARRVLFQWLGLITMFVIIYAYFDRSGSAARVERADEVGPSLLWSVVTHGLCVAVPTALFLWLFVGSRSFEIQQRAALEALGDGQYERAAELFGALAHRFRAKPSLGPVAAYNQGYALIRAGDAARAAGVLLGVERWPGLPFVGIRQAAAVELARAFAIGGDVAKAEQWLDAARARGAGALDRGAGDAQLAAVAGLVLCRAGKLTAASEHFEQTWERIQAKLTVRDMRELWLLRAFATGHHATPRSDAASETWLQLLRATSPGSQSWLTAQWPELARFAASHGVGARASASNA